MRNLSVHLLLLGALVTGCTVAPVPAPAPSGPAVPRSAPAPSGAVAQSAFNPKAVAARVEPVAEAMCRRRIPQGNCDFLILVDTRPGQPANAFQTIGRNGRPVIVFTEPLLADMRNADEMAFVLGHESAHHIEGHIPKTQQTAMIGAVSAGFLIALAGGNASAIEGAQQMGAFAGSRAYSKQFELEADALGTVIASNAGYDPVAGAQFFARIPDPGDTFLGSHPPNADRQRIVQQTAAQLR